MIKKLKMRIFFSVIIVCLVFSGCDDNAVQKDNMKKHVQRPIPLGDDLEAFVLGSFETYLKAQYLSFEFQCTEDYQGARMNNPATKVTGNMFYSGRDYSSTFSDSCTIINKIGTGYLRVMYKDHEMYYYSPVYVDTTKNPNPQLNIRELIKQTLNLRDTSKKMILNSDTSVRITLTHNYINPYIDIKFNFDDSTISGIMIARQMQSRKGNIGISENKFAFWNIKFTPPLPGNFALSNYIISDVHKKITGTTKQYDSYRLYVDDTLVK